MSKNMDDVLTFLSQAYQCGLPLLIAQSYSDRLSQAGGFAFHYGTPDPQMRRIASWILTNSNSPKQIIDSLWKRHGREDLKLAGLLLANTSSSTLKCSPWEYLFGLIGRMESIESLLEVIEELKRAEQVLPGVDELIALAKNSKLAYQLVLLIMWVCNIKDVSTEFIAAAPEGGEVFERIRQRLME